MAKRSLYASEEGARLARKIFDRRGWTQEHLAAELDLRTRQPIWRFFTCRPIERYIFIELCAILDLNWWEIAQEAPEPLLNGADKSFEQTIKTKQLADQVRLKHQVRIEHQCSTLRILGTAYPVRLDDLFVMPHFAGRPTAQSLSGYRLSETHIAPNLVIPLWPVLEEQPRLRILGKPGSGKTTLLKWIALQCSREQFQPDLIPVLIRLGSYLGSAIEKSEFTLLNCIQQELLGSGISDSQAVETLLNQGKFLLLLDELDEIPNPGNVSLAFREISQFCERYHKNRVIVASRLGSQDFELLPLADYELADFDGEQIARLANQWFNVFTPQQNLTSAQATKSSSRADEFLAQLHEPANQRIRELAGVPLLFNRICQTFQSRGPLFARRDRIYEECLSLLLGEWDRKRGIQRNFTDAQLSLGDQIHILGQIAVDTLKKGCYCFEQKDLEYCIEANIRERESGQQSSGQQSPGQQSPGQQSPILRAQFVAQAKLAFLQQGVLVEQDCGILCFSQLAFQDHLAARHIASSPDLEQSLDKLLDYLNQPDWREIFLLVSARLQDQTVLLQRLEVATQTLVVQNPSLKLLLSQLQQKNDQWLLYCQLNQIQIELYESMAKPELILHLATPIAYIDRLAQMLLLETLLTELALSLITSNHEDLKTYRVVQPLLTQVVELAISCQAHALANSLLHLKDQLFCCDWSDTDANQQTNEIRWLNCLNQIIFDCFHLEPLTQFEAEQVQVIQAYLYAIQLFADCQEQLGNGSASQLDEFFPLLTNVIRQTIRNANQLLPQTEVGTKAAAKAELQPRSSNLPDAKIFLPNWSYSDSSHFNQDGEWVSV
jgi:predicted NACHT family NTPase